MRSPVSFVTGFRFALHAGVSYAPHRHRVVEIVLHAAGSGILHCAGAQVPFAAGDATITPPGQVHHQSMHEPGTDFCLLVSPRGELAVPLTRTLLIRGALSPTLRQEITALTEVPRTTAPHARLESDLRAATVLAGLLERARPVARDAEGGDASFAQAAAGFMAERYATLGSLREVARAFAVSPSHLRQRFIAWHGVPPVRWLIQLRIARAKELLAHSSLSLREIAAACGFGSDQYLCAVFRRLEGKAPGSYRS
jgi:AraC family transcriptional regulator, transcriptional activator of pobA